MIGAQGAVGSSLHDALAQGNQTVRQVSSRAPLAGHPDVIDLQQALAEIQSESFDLVVHAAGPGDHRADREAWELVTKQVASAVALSGIPGVLLSTIRVLEGYESDFSDDSSALPRTVYAENNALNESVWLHTGGPSASVLRLTNFFSSPASFNSPQAALLPWSLVTEALLAGAVGIRSGSNFSKEFISGADIASAVVHIATSFSSGADVPSVMATVPGLTVSMADFAWVVQRAFARVGLVKPRVSFGPDSPIGPRCASGWLASSGWAVGLSLASIEDAVVEWIRAQQA